MRRNRVCLRAVDRRFGHWAAAGRGAAEKPAAKKPAAAPAGPKPTLANVAYGTHPRQVLDFWKAESRQPTPLLFFIHGGGWVSGDKDRVGRRRRSTSRPASRSSRSTTASSPQAMAAGVKPPVEVAAARRRAGAAVRPQQGRRVEHRQGAHRRVGRFGGRVFEPVAGVSRRHGRPEEQRPGRPRVDAAVVRRRDRRADHARPAADEGVDAQQPLRRPRLRLHGRPKAEERATRSSTQFLAGREKILPWIKEYSPYELVTADDPPVYLIYSAPPALGQEQKDPTHTANFGVKLQEKCKAAGVECELVYPGART